MRYVSDAAMRIFKRSDDDYPNTGVQPFEGTPSKSSKWERWEVTQEVSRAIGKQAEFNFFQAIARNHSPNHGNSFNHF